MQWPANATERRWWRPGTNLPSASALDELEQRDQRIRSLDACQTETALRAREMGATWSQIGDALGISKQAAQKRYDRRLF